VLGFTRGEISYILLAEVALLIVAALRSAASLAWLTMLIAYLLDTELSDTGRDRALDLRLGRGVDAGATAASRRSCADASTSSI